MCERFLARRISRFVQTSVVKNLGLSNIKKRKSYERMRSGYGQADVSDWCYSTTCITTLPVF
jgi:hypothetical protein